MNVLTISTILLSFLLVQQPDKVLSPLPFDKLEGTVDVERPVFLSEKDISKTPEIEFSRLLKLHAKRQKELKTIEGRAWQCYIRASDSKGSVMLLEFSYLNSPQKLKRFKRFKKPEDIEKRVPPESYGPVYADISTPTMLVAAQGIHGRGIEIIRVKKPETSLGYDDPANFARLYFPNVYDYSPEELFSSFELWTQMGTLKYEVRSRDNLVEIASWHHKNNRENGERWICDLSKDGAVVHYDSPGTIGEIEYRQLDGIWIPKIRRWQKLDRKKKKLLSIDEIRYFDMKINGELKEDTFAIGSLPVTVPGLEVKDTRQMPMTTIPFRQLQDGYRLK